jgi:methylamine---glutamate N-methyltransferase subunit B
MQSFDLGKDGLRALNSSLHALKGQTNMTAWEVVNPKGAHAIAAGVDAPVDITVRGSTGYYCAGMNKQATIRIKGSAGPGVAENMMSGTVKGNASSRCGISMKGIDIVVHGNIGHMSCFMAQSGNVLVLGNAGEALGDSLYEARIFVRGTVKSLGADCIEKDMRDEHYALVEDLLRRGEADGKAKPEEFRRYGSARKLYTFNIDNASSY